MPLGALAALLFLGGIVYAILSRNWDIGAIIFSLGAVVLGLDRLLKPRSLPDRAFGWAFVLCGGSAVIFIAIAMLIEGRF